MAMSFFNAFNLPLTIARPFNTYGPRQSARAIIPSIISQIASGSKVIQVGDLSPTRDFNYVQDTCKGFVELAKSDEAIGEIVNIGSNFEISIKDTFELIKKIMNSNVQFEVDPQRIRPQKSEVSRLWCDNSKIEQLTGFKPQFSIESGLTKTIEWFAEPSNLNHYKTNLYNV
jgi:nucleoside-diphosphate-sugar epimerase